MARTSAYRWLLWLLAAPALLALFALGVALSSAPVAQAMPRTAPGKNAPTIQDAFMYFQPGTPGNCPAPPNGGTTQVGCRFVLDMYLDEGSNQIATAQQSYLTFTYQLLQNASVNQIAAACVLTGFITADTTTFDAVLENAVCNGPYPCTFRGLPFQPGYFAYASGALGDCPRPGCPTVWRIAQVGLCAVAPGRAVLHWQFYCPGPRNCDTEIVDINGELIHDPALFGDYVINIAGPSTPTPTPTPTAAKTPVPSPTPCDPRGCNLSIVSVGASCNPDNTVHYSATVNNAANCPVQTDYEVELQVNRHGNGYHRVLTQTGTVLLPPGRSTLGGNFCYLFPPNTRLIRVEFRLTPNHGCHPKRKSPPIPLCPRISPCQSELGSSNWGAKTPFPVSF